MYDLERGTEEKLTREAHSFRPVWHPGGHQVAFTFAGTGGSFDIHLLSLDGSLRDEPFVTTPTDERLSSWAPDGSSFVYVQWSTETGQDIWVADNEEPQTHRVLIATPLNDNNPTVSPDGKWIAYQSGNDLYVAGYPEAGGRVLVAPLGSRPSWSAVTPELFFRSGDNLMGVRYASDADEFRPGRPSVILEHLPTSGFMVDHYPHSDGERFLVRVPVEETESSEIHVVLNWFDELKRLAPAP